MTPHETKVSELARQIIRLHEYLSGAVKPSEKTITERILRHFPEPQKKVCGISKSANENNGFVLMECGNTVTPAAIYICCPYCGGKIKV
jgi:hypothetical protein